MLQERSVRIDARGIALDGDLSIPEAPRGVVLFAHGSGSGRHSPRNRFVAAHLNAAHHATLLLDLLTAEEEWQERRTRHLRFDIGLLAGRLLAATEWLATEPTTSALPIGYFGASTGGGAALVAAAERPGRVAAVVSRGGRPDLAGDALGRVHAQTLLIVGGDDEPVIGMNEWALARLSAPVKQLVIVPGATHLFEEPGTLEEVARLAADWFTRHLIPRPTRSDRTRARCRPGGTTMIFRDRHDAGRQLAARLAQYRGRDDLLVLALPRGGVPVGFEVAEALHAPLDVFLVRKLGVPGQEELAMGAIASGGIRVLNESVVQLLGLSEADIAPVERSERRELERREREYRSDRPPLDAAGKTVILVDDGLATGSSMRAAVKALRRLGPARIVVAVPVGARETCDELAQEADEAVCAREPEPFHAVGVWYEDFAQTTDEEVCDLLARGAGSRVE
jgi:putative phosphoribosyl transferase